MGSVLETVKEAGLQTGRELKRESKPVRGSHSHLNPILLRDSFNFISDSEKHPSALKMRTWQRWYLTEKRSPWKMKAWCHRRFSSLLCSDPPLLFLTSEVLFSSTSLWLWACLDVPCALPFIHISFCLLLVLHFPWSLSSPALVLSGLVVIASVTVRLIHYFLFLSSAPLSILSSCIATGANGAAQIEMLRCHRLHLCCARVCWCFWCTCYR